ncbi:MAG: hypothetical protein D6679_07965 [Candidatus Hydrogenedentota bacterium]|nr:MAG: hypothetical protein D6679_07965 [Candidatus Hydrogenedentota bacterium]
MHFDKKRWDGKPLPKWEEARSILPEPVFEGWPAAVEAYWGAWKIALRNMRQPTPKNGFVSNYMYMDFSNAIFAHDTTFMVAYGRYGHRLFSAVESFDNFYVKQHPTGEICREIGIENGEDYWKNTEGDPLWVALYEPHKNNPAGYYFTRPTIKSHPQPSFCSLPGLNDPSCMAWGEMESYRITADAARLRRILPVQKAWYDAFQVYVRAECGFYVTDWASADNHPRNPYLGYGVDVVNQMIHLAELLLEIGGIIGEEAGADRYRKDVEETVELVQRFMWHEETAMFYDLDKELRIIPFKAVFGFWPMLSGAATEEQCKALVQHLDDPKSFNRRVRVPTLAADQPTFTPKGSYFHGGVFPFTNHMVIRGLEKQGYDRLAREIAISHWSASVELFQKTGTVWEYLQPDEIAPGEAALGDPGEKARPDFAGWGALPVIGYLIEYAIGLKADAPANTVIWNLTETKCCGCRRFAFGDVVTDLVALERTSSEEEPRLELQTNKPYKLILRWGKNKEKRISVGEDNQKIKSC